MGTSIRLTRSVSATHDGIAERLEVARTMTGRRDDPRLERAHIDQFLASTSQHLHAVDAVLLPPARRCADGRELVKDHLRSARELEVLLYHVKAHEYGSAPEQGHSWPVLWQEVDQAVADERRHEEVLVRRLTAELPDDDLERLADTLETRELRQPTRPHPHLPHTGPAGLLARGFAKIVDGFWDTAENRSVPRPEPKHHKAPGLLTQYLTCDPRFEPTEDPTE